MPASKDLLPEVNKIIDVHAHAFLPSWKKAYAKKFNMNEESISVEGMDVGPWSPEKHIEFMDRNGIEVSILSWPGGVSFEKGKKAASLARAMNEEFAEIVSKYPHRFGAFAVVPLDSTDAANQEMSYALDFLDLEGVCSPTQTGGAYLGDARYEPWFAEMNRRKTVLFAHPGAPLGLEQVYVGPNVSTLEFMFESTRMITKLILSGFKEKFRDINIISTHGGGTIPFLAHRLAVSIPVLGRGNNQPPLNQTEILELLGSFYYDLTAATSPAQLLALTKLVPVTKLIMGFDFPLMPEDTVDLAIKSLIKSGVFEHDQLKEIYSGNAVSLFKRW